MDYNLFNIVMDAQPMGKVTIFVLMFASIYSFAVMFGRAGVYKRVAEEADDLMRLFRQGPSIKELRAAFGRETRGLVADMLESALDGLDEFATGSKSADARAREHARLDRLLARSKQETIVLLENRLGILATVANSSVSLGYSYEV